jgi:small subunit ribosomal protein S4
MNKLKTPGEHGKILKRRSKRNSLSDDFRNRLLSKQKVRFNYGISEKQLFSYYKQAKIKKGSTGTILFQLLESRLDCLVFRLGFAPTIPAARQLINHRHILVNNKIINIPSFICKINDLISIKAKENSKKLVSQILTIIELRRKVLLERSQNYYNRRLNELKALKNKRKLRKFLFAYKLPVPNLLPEHLDLNSKDLLGKLIDFPKLNNILIRVDQLKIIEYYSR